MNTGLVSLQSPETSWSYRDDSIIVGKDILEVLSSAMYVDPLAIYREYLQNAADAIDEARRIGVLTSQEAGLVEIELDLEKRTARIRDNGTGIPAAEFETRMTSFGASAKRGTNARGFRGVGRLSGLGYCQELLFRSRSAGESKVTELHWDCRKAKVLLRSADFAGDLAAVVAQCVQTRRIDGRNWPKHFFEVELIGVPRLRNDWLLNPSVIEEYLSQVAPLPFSPEFRFAGDISAILSEHIGITHITLKIAGNNDSIFRPHRDSFDVTGGVDKFQELQPIQISATDGGTAAIGWILHHGYKGAVPNANLKGLRLRSGNMQVGGNGLLEDLFTEIRFNSWCVGEIHVIDSRIIPNGRRDHYEQNVHYTNLINQLSPIARQISVRCRQSSTRRNWLRQVERQQDQVQRDLEIVKQGSLGASERQLIASQIQQTLDLIDKALAKDALKADAQTLVPVLAKLRRDFAKVRSTGYSAKVLARLAPVQRKAYEQAFALIYECSNDKAHAKLLVDRMLVHLPRRLKKKKS
jgi:Histidine kinase-, DNA gyrase B-, and HSP90-like ATPase